MSNDEASTHEAIGDKLHGDTSALFEQIIDTPAASPAGLAVKAKVLAYESDLEQLDEASIAASFAAARYFLDRAALSLVLDCLTMARARA